MSNTNITAKETEEGEGPVSNRPRLNSTSVRSSILSIIPDDFKDLLSTDGPTSQPATMMSSVSPGSSRAGTPRKRRSAFDFMSAGKSASGDEKNREQNTDETSLAESKSTWRMRLTSDLEQEASSTNLKTNNIEGQDVSKRLEKVRERKEETKKVRQTKNREMKTLMEQVASIAAQSRGIMRAQPRQSEQQRLMGEIISHMGKMADKMSKLMLATEPPDEDEEDTSTKSPGMLNADEAEAKADQILVLLSNGGDDYELEWKRMEIKSILMSESQASRRRTTEKQKALEGLALDSTRSDRSGGSRRSRSSLSRQQSTRSTRSSRSNRSSSSRRAGTDRSESSAGKKSRSTRRSKSVGEKTKKEELSSSMSESWQGPAVNYALLNSPKRTEQDTPIG